MQIGGMILVAVLFVIIYIIATYNNLVKLKTQIQASIQEIGNQLKRQASLIPNLESSTKGYLKHEKGIFSMLSEARKSVTTAQKSNNVEDIDKALDQLNAVVPKINVTVESNPELKGDKTVTKLMEELADTADKLSYSRRSVIDLSQRYNQKLIMFPSNIIANMFNFKKAKGIKTPTEGEHTQVSENELKDPKVNLDK